MNMGIDYNEIRLTMEQRILLYGQIGIQIICMVFIFYRSLIGVLILIPFFVLELHRKKQQLQKRRMEKLNQDFKDVMLLIANGLSIGYSLENSIITAREEFLLLNQGGGVDMNSELENMCRKLELNVTVETILTDFSNRCMLEDVKSFTDVVIIAKEHGGNLVKIIQKTVNSIISRNQVKEEIATLVAAKRLEQNIMSYMPMGIVFYLSLTNPAYVMPLYHNIIGIIVVSVAIILTQTAMIWAMKVIEIEV